MLYTFCLWSRYWIKKNWLLSCKYYMKLICNGNIFICICQLVRMTSNLMNVYRSRTKTGTFWRIRKGKHLIIKNNELRRSPKTLRSKIKFLEYNSAVDGEVTIYLLILSGLAWLFYSLPYLGYFGWLLLFCKPYIELIATDWKYKTIFSRRNFSARLMIPATLHMMFVSIKPSSH